MAKAKHKGIHPDKAIEKLQEIVGQLQAIDKGLDDYEDENGNVTERVQVFNFKLLKAAITIVDTLQGDLQV